MGLQDFLNVLPDKQQEFERIKKLLLQQGKSNAEATAQAQVIVFKPNALEAPVISTNKLEAYYVTFYFETKEEFDLICKHFHVNGYNDYNTHYTKPLIEFIKEKQKDKAK